MEARKITIVSTRTQEKKVIMSSATTLGELKRDLDRTGVNYQDMTFYEGLSKTELIDDGSILPHDVLYKGQTTNELVFMLTSPNKKIKSGAVNRKEIYNGIKEYHLEDACIRKYGKNYTLCKSEDLLKLIEEHHGSTSKEEAPKGDLEKEVTSLRTSIKCLLDSLVDAEILEREEATNILSGKYSSNTAKPKKELSTYSDDEIDEMFDFV